MGPGDGEELSPSSAAPLPVTIEVLAPSSGRLEKESLSDAGGLRVDQRSPPAIDLAEVVPTSPYLKGRTRRVEALEWVSSSLRGFLSEAFLCFIPLLFCLVPLSLSSCSHFPTSCRKGCRGPIGWLSTS